MLSTKLILKLIKNNQTLDLIRENIFTKQLTCSLTSQNFACLWSPLQPTKKNIETDINETLMYIKNNAIPIQGDEITKAEFIKNFNLAGGRSTDDALKEIAGADLRCGLFYCKLPAGTKALKYIAKDLSAVEINNHPSAGGFVSMQLNTSPADLGLNNHNKYYCYVAETTQEVSVIVEKSASIPDWQDKNMINIGGAYALRTPRGAFSITQKYMGTTSNEIHYTLQPENLIVNQALQKKLKGDNRIDIINPAEIERLTATKR